MAGLLFPAPPVYDLPLSRGGDLFVSLTHVDDDDNEITWPTGASLTLFIDTDSGVPVSVSGSIDDAVSEFSVPHAKTDGLRSGLLWRAVYTPPLSGRPEVLVNGETVRADGEHA